MGGCREATLRVRVTAGRELRSVRDETSAVWPHLPGWAPGGPVKSCVLSGGLTVELMLIVVLFLMLILLLNEFHFIFFSLLVIKLGMEPGRFDLIHNFWE